MELATAPTLTALQSDALSKIRALKKVTRDTGMITKRSQNEILGSLSTDDLAVVARELYSNKSTTNEGTNNENSESI
jgi:hypothetical protein